jgi:hypothetical protein
MGNPVLVIADDRLELYSRKLDDCHIPFETTASESTDISETAPAFIESVSGEKLWPFDDGKDIHFDQGRHTAGK